MVLKYGEWSNLRKLRKSNSSAHKSTHCCSNGRTEMIPCTATHPAKATKYFVYPQLPNIPHYLAEAYITVTNNILPWMKDLHSADLPIGTTESITSHNESLQVVKSSAIAKHLTEWSGILWKTSISQGIQQS